MDDTEVVSTFRGHLTTRHPDVDVMVRAVAKMAYDTRGKTPTRKTLRIHHPIRTNTPEELIRYAFALDVVMTDLDMTADARKPLLGPVRRMSPFGLVSPPKWMPTPSGADGLAIWEISVPSKIRADAAVEWMWQTFRRKWPLATQRLEEHPNDPSSLSWFTGTVMDALYRKPEDGDQVMDATPRIRITYRENDRDWTPMPIPRRQGSTDVCHVSPEASRLAGPDKTWLPKGPSVEDREWEIVQELQTVDKMVVEELGERWRWPYSTRKWQRRSIA